MRASYAALFPRLPEESRFSRRAQFVREALRPFRKALLAWADADVEPVRLLDSFPLPLIAEQRVLVVPGDVFGEGGAGHVRCCYATATAKLEIALTRLSEFLKQF